MPSPRLSASPISWEVQALKLFLLSLASFCFGQWFTHLYFLKVWENYDFIERDYAGGKQYAATWAGAFPLPPMMGPGRSSMHGYFQRYDNYADVPDTLRSFIEEYANDSRGL